MAKHEALPKSEGLNEAGMIEAIGFWEEHLEQIAAKAADQEFGRVQEHFQKIGQRIAHRAAGEARNVCASCGGPLPGRGPADTIPIWVDAIAGYRNQFACSETCGAKLKKEMHDRELKRLSA
jgi:hypothetical protein